jgi:hypothetical protein
MPVVPFLPRVDPGIGTIRARSPACDVTVAQAGRTRRYLLWVDRPGRARLEIWFGRALHRTARASGLFNTRRLRSQVDRELRDLIADGWTVDDA